MYPSSLRNLLIALAIVAGTVLVPCSDAAGEDSAQTKIEQLAAIANDWPDVKRIDIGVTRNGTRIPALVSLGDHAAGDKTRITIVGQSGDTTLMAMKWFYSSEKGTGFRARYDLSAIPVVHPDQWAAGTDPPPEKYPPEANAYQSKDNPESQYLWNWLGMHAPDLVIVIRADDAPIEHGLAEQLPVGKPSLVGSIPTQVVVAKGGSIIEPLRELLDRGSIERSEARRELERRASRSPLEIARELSVHYGNGLDSVTYIPAVALIARLRLEELVDDPPLPLARSHAQAYLNGDKSALPDRPSGSHLSGHWYFAELARRGNDTKALTLAHQVADLGFDATGKPRESMPFHNEMSDAVFMGCPILVQVGHLTGETKYHDMALRHFRFMRQRCLREDDLYRHSPLDHAAWGRGNGFPALGLALCLSDMPAGHEAHGEMLSAFREHMAALAKHQDSSGMWHQVIDHSGSYREFSSTCMITFAMLRGMQHGWLDRETHGPIVERAWRAISLRIGSAGTLVDVCTGTGKQRSLRDYLDRKAILGRDARGGAMALLVATEMAAQSRERSQP